MLIGITTTHHKDLGAERVATEYLNCIQFSGGTPILLSPVSTSQQVDEILSCLRGILLTGGDDVDPTFYGSSRVPEETLETSPERDAFELLLIRKAYERNLPVFGICRGMQIMNVALGGTLHQDIKTAGISTLEHMQKTPYTNYCHTVTIETRSELARITDYVQGEEYPVNSIHHQAIDAVSDALRISAFSHDGIIEGLEGSEKTFFMGVQWHPEFLKHDVCLFEAFCKAACKQA